MTLAYGCQNSPEVPSTPSPPTNIASAAPAPTAQVRASPAGTAGPGSAQAFQREPQQPSAYTRIPIEVTTLESSPDGIRPRAAGPLRRSRFVPMDNPTVVSAQEGAYLPDDDLVLGLYWQGSARAYPVRMIKYHHIVNDTVAGRPVLITY